MTKTQQTKLDKVFALYNDNAAKQTEESAAAYAKLQTLCKAYKVDFDAYMKSKQSSTVQNSQREEAEPAPTKVFVNTKSRRGFIIEAILQGVWDRQSLAEVIADFFPQYQDKKRNAGAVTGTINDLRNNSGWDIRTCDIGRIYVKKVGKGKK